MANGHKVTTFGAEGNFEPNCVSRLKIIKNKLKIVKLGSK